MTIDQAQQTVDQWIQTTGVRYFNELTNMAMLTEEVGEVARIIARQYGEQSFKESDQGKDLGDELADVLFVVHLPGQPDGGEPDRGADAQPGQENQA
jgi:NTP pyrophosphatase (non-canonical NTP hydrolase)